MLILPFAAFLIVQGTSRDTTQLQDQLRRIIASSGAEVAVAYRSLDGSAELFSTLTSRFTPRAR